MHTRQAALSGQPAGMRDVHGHKNSTKNWRTGSTCVDSHKFKSNSKYER